MGKSDKKRPLEAGTAEGRSKRAKSNEDVNEPSVVPHDPAPVTKEKKEKKDKKEDKEKKDKKDKKEKKDKKDKKNKKTKRVEVAEEPVLPEDRPTDQDVSPSNVVQSSLSTDNLPGGLSDVEYDDDSPDSRADPTSSAMASLPSLYAKSRSKPSLVTVVRRTDDGTYKPAHAPDQENMDYPLFTQPFSLYVPIFPGGFDQPLRAAQEQHLRPMINRYNPTFHGVLLGYRNVTIGDQPGRLPPAGTRNSSGSSSSSSSSGAGPHIARTDAEGTQLRSRDEYAVGFGWVTADLDIFCPSRGAWMEGSVILQNEGHIGVICWGLFNASIEASRLPRSWRWIHAGDDEFVSDVSESSTPAAFNVSEDVEGGECEEEGEPNQQGNNGLGGYVADGMTASSSDFPSSLEPSTATGYWVDEQGDKIRGKLQFRIKSFDAGMTGDHSYISIEGTMLNDAEEQRLRGMEKRKAAARRKSSIGVFQERRRMPAFSITDMGSEEAANTSAEVP